MADEVLLPVTAEMIDDGPLNMTEIIANALHAPRVRPVAVTENEVLNDFEGLSVLSVECNWTGFPHDRQEGRFDEIVITFGNGQQLVVAPSQENCEYTEYVTVGVV